MKLKTLALCASIALVTACGGDSPAPPPATGGGGGTPGPSPSPSPTPTTTTFNSLTGDQTFNTACAANPFSNTGASFTTFSDFFTFAFAAATETWTVAGNTGTSTLDESFGPSDITFENEEVIAYGKDSSLVINGRNVRNIFGITTPQVTGGIAEYVRIGSVFIVPEGEQSQAQFQCVFGVATELDDPLPTTTLNFGDELQSVGTAVRTVSGSNPVGYNLDATEVSLTANPDNGQIEFTLTLQGREIIPNPAGGPAQTSDTVTAFGTFTGTAGVSDTVQGYEGLVFDANGDFSGDFTGWFFGPQGAEIGFAVTGTDQLQDTSNLSFYLALAGPQN